MDEPFPALHQAIPGCQSDINWENCYHEDRGDETLIPVSPDIPENVLVSRFPRELPAALESPSRAG